jgi:hypothetical protein
MIGGASTDSKSESSANACQSPKMSGCRDLVSQSLAECPSELRCSQLSGSAILSWFDELLERLSSISNLTGGLNRTGLTGGVAC